MIKDKTINNISENTFNDIKDIKSVKNEIIGVELNSNDIFNIANNFISNVKSSFETLTPFYIPSIGTFKILEGRMEALEKSNKNK